MQEATAELRALAEAAIGALNAADLDACLALVTEDVEFTSMIAEAEGTPTFYGHDGVREWWETIIGTFEEAQWELLEVRGTAEGGVSKLRMSGTLGGVTVRQTVWQAVRLRAGKVAWWRIFRTEREALDAAGLRE